MRYIANKNLGRLDAAKSCIDKALQLSPNAGPLVYNYSIFLQERNGIQASLDYLISMKDKVKGYRNNDLRIMVLKNAIGENIVSDAKNIVDEYKETPQNFSLFAKENILPSIFRIAGEPYAFVDPKKLTSKEDESKYLKSSDTPINLDDLPF
jgi:tetratricopeptide (TPR) repeat protein